MEVLGCLGVIIIWLYFGILLATSGFIDLQIIGWLVLSSPFVIFGVGAVLSSIIDLKEAFKKVKQGSEKDLDFLINKVIKNQFGSRYSAKLLTKLKSSQAIDLFCQKWSQNRHEKLTKILVRSGYVATQPDDVRVLSALKVGKIKTCIDQNPKLVKCLLSAFEDQDLDIASRSKKYAISLNNQSAIDELFYLCVEESNQIAYQCIQQAQYQSTNIKYKAFFHFLRDEWNAYDDLDFDQAILQEIYQSVSPELRKIIAEKARKWGWTEWLKVAQKSREKMNLEDWEITISILKNNREFAKMWQLVRQSPIWGAQKLLVELSQSSYTPSPENHIFYQPLLLLANHCQMLKISEINTNSKNQLLFSADGDYQAISPDSQFLLTKEDRQDKNPKVWRIADGQLLLSAQGDYQAISPDSQFLLTMHWGTKLWQIADGQLLFSADGKYKEISPDSQFLSTTDYDNKNPKVWRIADGQLLFSADGHYKEISPDWQFLLTSNYKGENPKVWRASLLTIQSYFFHKFTDRLTIQDMNLLQDLKKNPVSNYVYPIVTEEQKPWLDLMIKLAEYNLSFDVDITEDSPPAEMSEFDIDIEGHAISDFDIEIESHEIHDLDFDIEIED